VSDEQERRQSGGRREDDLTHADLLELREELLSLRNKLIFGIKAQFIALGIFFVCSVIVVWQIVSYLDDIQDERQARSESISGIIELNCTTNNQQDALLAQLVEASLNQQGFAVGVQVNLTAFDRNVIQTVRKVQKAESKSAEDTPTALESVFDDALEDLKDTESCDQLVSSFLSGQEINAEGEG
jgi:hypothetical protein